ncbi:hypothetical protein Phi18:2_gp04 [Cellulophaga phage phi18:2]|uniref:Uncharacterized protein n=2 Tax=Cellulophaga phage phi18:1 TaxID=1327982 RepID=S0A413_9CAUD|nr:hypothetical protein Phi18:2_gp04 [Cellulophaga phage phi18:2]
MMPQDFNMKRISKANIKKTSHPLTKGERLSYHIDKNKNTKLLIDLFDLEIKEEL